MGMAYLALRPLLSDFVLGMPRGATIVYPKDAAIIVGLADLYRLFPDKVALVSAFMARIDGQVLAGTASSVDPEETARDRLFDVMMRRYDALRAHRAALRALRRASKRDPLLALALARPAKRSLAAMLEAASLSSDGLAGAVRQNGLMAIHRAVLTVFDSDETTDLSTTMAALDTRLKTAERWSQLLDKYTHFTRRTKSGASTQPST